MTPKIVPISNIDMYQSPKPIEGLRAEDGSEWTLGDLHGSFIKLLHFLGLHGLIDNNDDRYQRLLSIYLKDTNDLTKDDLDQFDTLINSIVVTQPNALVRLIGDTLADRGMNDYFTLKLLSKLKAKNLKLEILLSNHDFKFIRCFEQKFPFHTDPTIAAYFQSMTNLQLLIDKGLVSLEEVTKMIEEYYKPALKLVSYSLNEAKDEIVLYSHAVMGFETVKDLAKKLKVNYDDTTAETLAQCIDRINEAYAQQYIAKSKVHLSHDETACYYANTLQKFDHETHPFVVTTHNRNSYKIKRPHEKNNYRIYYAHGHDMAEPSHDHIFNLDNVLAKYPDILKGYYHVLHFDPRPQKILESVSERRALPYPSQLTARELLEKLSDFSNKEHITPGGSYDDLSPTFRQYWDTQTKAIRANQGYLTPEQYWAMGAKDDEKGDVITRYIFSQ